MLPRWLARGAALPARPVSRRAGGRALSLAGTLRRLPLITKQDIRRDFPSQFPARDAAELDALLDQDLVELEHTSGTSEERTPLLLGRGWWAEQEERALRLNSVRRRRAR